MATTNFRLALSTVFGEPDEPPIDAWPVGYGRNQIAAPPTVIWPSPTAVDGLNRPVAAVGAPYTIFGRDRINATGYSWYNEIIGGAAYVEVKVTLYDERTQSWTVWKGYMWQPTHSAAAVAGVDGPEYTDFRVRITGLEPSMWIWV